MASLYDCSIEAELLTGLRLARGAIARGELVVVPTDTVYGVAADAFDAEAVQRLLDAKGRGRQHPPPVLVPGVTTLDALAVDVPDAVRSLVAAFWPGGLTIVLPAQPSLVWDLGETNGTVALRMPSDRIVLELLAETGPLAVSSANSTGMPAARTAAEARGMLGDSVAVYLETGPAGGGYDGADGRETSSTIVDATALAAGTGPVRVLRHGVIPEARLRELVPEAFEVPEPPADETPEDLAPEDHADADADADPPADAASTEATEPDPSGEWLAAGEPDAAGDADDADDAAPRSDPAPAAWPTGDAVPRSDVEGDDPPAPLADLPEDGVVVDDAARAEDVETEAFERSDAARRRLVRAADLQAEPDDDLDPSAFARRVGRPRPADDAGDPSTDAPAP